MPNHVYSRVVVKGDESEIEQFINATKKQDGWDLNSLYPNPLTGFSSPVRIVSEEEYQAAKRKLDEQVEKGEPFLNLGLPMTIEMQYQFILTHDTADWYQWAKMNWGTKWGIYAIEEEIMTNKEIVLRYQTAWSPATVLWLKISEQFPDLVFETEFFDEGWHFAGRESYNAGLLLDEENVKVTGREGIRIAENVGYPIED